MVALEESAGAETVGEIESTEVVVRSTHGLYARNVIIWLVLFHRMDAVLSVIKSQVRQRIINTNNRNYVQTIFSVQIHKSIVLLYGEFLNIHSKSSFSFLIIDFYHIY